MWHCYQIFWYTTASSIVMTMIYIFFLKLCAGPMLFVSIALILVFGLMAGYGAYTKVEAYENTGNETFSLIGSLIIWGYTTVFVLFICS